MHVRRDILQVPSLQRRIQEVWSRPASVRYGQNKSGWLVVGY